MTVTSHSGSHDAALAGCGERLRAARIAAGLSIDDVASRLRMPARVVRSLEAEDWSRLGAPVFVRGQIRSYSRLMGLTTAPMMAALDVGPVEPTKLVSRSYTPKLQWWAEQIGRRLVYVVLTASLAIPAWVATQQHLAPETESVAALDAPVVVTDADGATHADPKTVVASMAPVSVMKSAAAASSEIVLRTRGEAWVEAIAKDGRVLEKDLLGAGSERRFATSVLQSLTIGNASEVALENRGETVELTPLARANVVRFEVSSDGSLTAIN